MSTAAERLHMQLWAFEDIRQPRKALTLIFDALGDWCMAEEFELVREVLRTVRLEKHSITVALGFASITLVWREELGEARADYVAKLTAWVRAKDPVRVDALMKGLA